MDTFTTSMIALYDEEVMNNPINSGMFLSSFFQNELTHPDAKISIDVIRTNRAVAKQVVIGAGGNPNDYGEYTTKEYVPPMYDEYIPINVFDGFARLPGENPINVIRDYQARVLARAVSAQVKLTNKIIRAKELQAAQALFNGKVTLKYSVGDSLFVDFKQKATHNVNVTTAWSNVAADAIGDIETMCRVVATDGFAKPTVAVFGHTAWANFNKNTAVNARLDQRNRNPGQISKPEWMDKGGVFHGTYTFGAYELEMWTYEGMYDDPENSEATTYYVPENKVMIIAPDARRDIHYAAVPCFQVLEDSKRAMYNTNGLWVPTESKMLPYLQVDMMSMANISGVRSRPLYVPHAIDCHGIIDTTVAS